MIITDFITVAPDGRRFVDGRGQSFLPWGFNYDRSYFLGADVLLEELIERSPAKLDEDFAKARELGANTVRLFLQHSRYQPRLGEIDAGALDRLDVAIAAARRHDLRVDLTGLSHIDTSDVAHWYAEASDDDIIAAEALFWQNVAERYADEPAIFCYDLQNEPYINWHDSRLITVGYFTMGDGRRFSYCNAHLKEVRAAWGRWVRSRYESLAVLTRAWHDFPTPGEDWVHIETPQQGERPHDPRLLDFQAFREEHAVRWTQALVTAIRRHDRRHPITIGLLPGSVPFDTRSPRGYTGFAPHRLAPWLDFISIHLYPSRSAERERYLTENLMLHELILLGCQVGKPVVIEEWFALGDGIARGYVTPGEWFDTFVGMSRPLAQGWFSFYHAVLDDRPNARALSDTTDWLERFRRMSSALEEGQGESWAGSIGGPAGDAELTLDRSALLTSSAACTETFRKYVALRTQLRRIPRLCWQDAFSSCDRKAEQ